MRTATFTLLGLRYEAAFAEQLFREIVNMEESTTYQALISRGRTLGQLDEARRFLLRLGRGKLGEPDAAVLATLERISEPAQLEALGESLFRVATWNDLLANL